MTRPGGNARKPPEGTTSAGRPVSMNAASTSSGLVGTAVCRVRFADDNKIGITGVAGENDRQAVERAGFPSCFERNRSLLGRLAGRSQYRIGLGFRVAQMFADDIGRQVITSRPAQKVRRSR